MPEGAHRECSKPRCGNYAERNGYCKEHQRAALQRPEWLHAVSKLQTCARFRRARHSFLVRHPVCAMCNSDGATVLDHIVPHRGRLALFWDQTNWQGLCYRCHGVKTRREIIVE